MKLEIVFKRRTEFVWIGEHTALPAELRAHLAEVDESEWCETLTENIDWAALAALAESAVVERETFEVTEITDTEGSAG